VCDILDDEMSALDHLWASTAQHGQGVSSIPVFGGFAGSDDGDPSSATEVINSPLVGPRLVRRPSRASSLACAASRWLTPSVAVCSRSMRCQASIGWRQLRSEMLRGGSRAGRGRRGWETILICVCDGELPLRVCEITPAFKCEGLRAVGPSLISGRAFALARSLRRRPCWLPTPGTYVWIRTHRNLVPNLWHKFVRRFVRPCFHQIVQRARKRLVRNFQTGRRGRLQRRERESRAPFACTRPSSTPACSWRSVWIRRRRHSRAQVSPQPERRRRMLALFWSLFTPFVCLGTTAIHLSPMDSLLITGSRAH